MNFSAALALTLEEVLVAEDKVLATEVQPVVAAEDSPKNNQVDMMDTVPDDTFQELIQDDSLEQQASPNLTQDEARGNQAS